eukprot:scaffold377137_cov17-Prasinocladus_malaysianus.AAC.1
MKEGAWEVRGASEFLKKAIKLPWLLSQMNIWELESIDPGSPMGGNGNNQTNSQLVNNTLVV